jgi:hypothetical protein
VTEALGGGESASAASTHSGEHAPRARGRTARSAPPALGRGDGQMIDSMVHGSTPPCRASAPLRSATAGAMSERPALLSRSCPLRADERARVGHADAPAELDWTPCLCPSAHTGGWPDDAPRAAARPHTRRSTRPPTRMARRTRGPAHTHDTDQIDPPCVAAPARSGWTPAAILRMLPRGSAVHAPAAKARVVRPGPSPSPSQCSTSSTPRPVVSPPTAARPTLTAPPSAQALTARSWLTTSPPQALTSFQSPPLDPPSDHLHPGELLV